MKAQTPTHRLLLGTAAACVIASASWLLWLNQAPVRFKASDITGAQYATDFRLKDHMGNLRSMADFRGKVVVIFFGYTQCPDVCPTSMNTMAEVKRLLGEQGKRLQVVFITVDPERDSSVMLKDYMHNFDPSFLALQPESSELHAVAENFKVYYAKVPGKTPTSYSMDHSAGKYIFDPDGRIRLFAKYGAPASDIADDISKLLLGK